MSDDAKDTLATGAGILMAVVGIAIAGWIVIQACAGIGSWFKDHPIVTLPSAEEQKKADEEWSKDPRNPKVAGQACIDRGGIPRYSNWDGEVFRCDIIETPEKKQ